MIGSVDDLMRLAHDDPKYIIESAFLLINKQKEPTPFIFNDPQNMFYSERTTRDDILKAGQLGFSTMIEAILTIKFLLVPNSWSVTISHEDEATKRLFEKVDYYLTHLPDWLKPFYEPGKTTEGDMVNKAMNSKFYIGTAGARAFGRGDTIHYAHLSETSRWKGNGRMMTGVIRAVPLNDPHTWIVKETTANGEGSLHHQEYKRAKENTSEDGFHAHFIPFFSNPDYRIPGAVIPVGELTSKEKQLLNRFPKEKAEENKGYVDIETLAWRRKQIANLNSEGGFNPEQIFQQEFPADDVEAFLGTGNPIFSPEHLANYKSRARKPIAVGNLVGAMGEYTLNEVENGWLKLWNFPTLTGKYIIFADVGQYSDRCVATVLDKKTWNVVAKFRAQITSHTFGDELNALGHFFNDAEMAVEANNMGQSTIDRLVDLRYPNMYMRERVDEKTKTVSNVYGWQTTAKTKALMIGHMQNIVNTEEVDIPDIEILNEMTTFVKTEEGGMEASAGNLDDCVISISGAYYVLKLHPFVETKRTTPNNTAEKVRKFKALRSGSAIKRWRQQ